MAPSLLQKDRWGNWVISDRYREKGKSELLVQAICKLEGFTYAPSDAEYWKQGYSTETDFIYVTTQTLTHDQLQQISEDVGADRTLLVLCSAFHGKGEAWANLTVRKIPKQVLDRCEWGHDDYSLKIENLPKAPPPADETPTPAQKRRATDALTASLFAEPNTSPDYLLPGGAAATGDEQKVRPATEGRGAGGEDQTADDCEALATSPPSLRARNERREGGRGDRKP